jgi:hypothetical protein
MLRGIGSKRMAAGSGLERSAIQQMARVSPAEHTVAALVDVWRRRRNQTPGTAQIAWAWPVVGSFVGLIVISAILIAT